MNTWWSWNLPNPNTSVHLAGIQSWFLWYDAFGDDRRCQALSHANGVSSEGKHHDCATNGARSWTDGLAWEVELFTNALAEGQLGILPGAWPDQPILVTTHARVITRFSSCLAKYGPFQSCAWSCHLGSARSEFEKFSNGQCSISRILTVFSSANQRNPSKFLSWKPNCFFRLTRQSSDYASSIWVANS